MMRIYMPKKSDQPKENKGEILASLEDARQDFLNSATDIPKPQAILENPELEKKTDGSPAEEKTENLEERAPELSSAPNTDDTIAFDDSIAEEARKLGWVPKEEFRGDKSKWRDAQAWIDRTELFDRIKGLKNELHSRDEIIAELRTYYQQQAESDRNKLIEERKEAVKNGNIEEFEKLDRQYNDLVLQNKKSAETLPVNNDIPQESQDFLARNSSWFNKDTEKNQILTEYAIKLDNKYAQQYPQMPLKERLQKVEESVKSEFNLDGAITTPVRNVSYGGAAKSLHSVNRKATPSFDSLSREEKAIVDHMVRSSEARHRNNPRYTKLTHDYYIKELVKSGVIKTQ